MNGTIAMGQVLNRGAGALVTQEEAEEAEKNAQEAEQNFTQREKAHQEEK